jgi:N-acetylmuramoyl-L-alanine amidase
MSTPPSGPPINPFPKPQPTPAVVALAAWRENRGGGESGMQSVINVLQNRAAQRGTDMYTEALRPEQFSSMTAKNDPQLTTWPALDDPNYAIAWGLAEQAIAGTLEDITGGATSYYAASMGEPPYWASSMTPTVTISGQLFFRL